MERLKSVRFLSGNKIKSSKSDTGPSLPLWVCVWRGGLKTPFLLFLSRKRKAWAKYWSHLYSQILLTRSNSSAKFANKKLTCKTKLWENQCQIIAQAIRKNKLASTLCSTNIVVSCKPKIQGNETALIVHSRLYITAGSTNHFSTAVQYLVIPSLLYSILHQSHDLSAMLLSVSWLSFPGLPKEMLTNEAIVPVIRHLLVGQYMINF